MQDTQVRECKEEVSALVCKLKEALSRYVNVETEANFNNILYEIESQKSRYVSLKEKQARFNSSNTEYNKVKREVIQFLESYRFHAQEDVQEQLVSIQDHLHSYLSSEEELINMKLKKKEFKASEDVNKLMNVLESNTMENIQSIEDQLENITNQLFNTNRNITHYENEIQDLQIKSDELDDKESLLRLRENEYITEMKRYENINKVKEYLEKAKISFAEKYMQPTLEAFKEYYELVTEEDSSLYRMDANYDVTCMGGIKQREARLLSSGYRDLIGICMRMSFVRCMYPNEKPCLIMDDPFVNLDEAKTQGAIELISQISQEYQVIYMTCHRSRV